MVANDLIYSLGALLLSAGCIGSQFKKSGWYTLAKVSGFVLMTLAYVKKF